MVLLLATCTEEGCQFDDRLDKQQKKAEPREKERWFSE
jgi:hypothetical protein